MEQRDSYTAYVNCHSHNVTVSYFIWYRHTSRLAQIT